MENLLALINEVISKSGKHKGIRSIKKIGELHVPTGQIVVCDPLVDPEAPCLKQKFPQGNFPVYLYYDNQTDAVALAEIRFSEGPIEKWEMALVEGQEISELSEGEIFGYPVDAGLGCFMDTEGQKMFLKHENELMKQLGDKFVSYYDDYMDDLFYGPDAENENYCTIKPYKENPNNVIAFQSGLGDGLYASYIAYGKDGKATRLVTDFGIIE